MKLRNTNQQYKSQSLTLALIQKDLNRTCNTNINEKWKESYNNVYIIYV